MARNRLRPEHFKVAKQALDTALMWSKPALKTLAVGSVIGAVIFGLIEMANRAPYFSIKTFDAEATPHVSKDELAALIGLEPGTNLFKFDIFQAETALESHPWVADARVTKQLPDKLTVSLTERQPAGVLAMNALYVVSADGRPFVRVMPANALGLPLVTGLTREDFDADEARAAMRVTEALSLWRLYGRTSMAALRPATSVHIGEGGRLELMLGKTRVGFGLEGLRAKLERLEGILDTLTERRADAAYILLDDVGKWAIVKETSLAQPMMGAL